MLARQIRNAFASNLKNALASSRPAKCACVKSGRNDPTSSRRSVTPVNVEDRRHRPARRLGEMIRRQVKVPNARRPPRRAGGGQGGRQGRAALHGGLPLDEVPWSARLEGGLSLAPGQVLRERVDIPSPVPSLSSNRRRMACQALRYGAIGGDMRRIGGPIAAETAENRILAVISGPW
ncbi:hypothetical protein CcrBL47_gp521c [Caulobacter phage BL47]|nr:hypothetical protein CcrC2_gp482c [Caulobacter phage C2]UTU09291.1 hypothetical protein CcrBL47_gp005c [Caulobacter phage BL47]UTU09867.1 hypothetical protein CcrRB23_gp499c [Caulobacter phage RB23]WGN97419.1 hypothetical protein [Bertelyvirus sp.]UTU09803.1 hypothetical protein CcrBL47_gp521c [Caulobacter phage BL47]